MVRREIRIAALTRAAEGGPPAGKAWRPRPLGFDRPVALTLLGILGQLRRPEPSTYPGPANRRHAVCGVGRKR
ncbi:hypothetical protein B590_08490 [Streptomyces sp. PVA_94-07]|nr:hypothetical protein B590_08490 [Streptomyces sp. PVA_94-07]